ncbi:MAG: hypothetical protein J6Y58_09880 [Clostridiales bacterium]|nr:hypothetical protein [Clostridiales bacterium]
MKTTMKKVAAIVMVGAMALAMAACKKSAKKVSVDDFKKACEEVGLTVEDLGGGDGAKEQYEVKNADNTLEVTYVIAEKSDDAKKAYEMATEGIEALEGLGADVKKSSGKLVVSKEDKLYAATVQSGDMFLSISASGADAVKTAKELASKLGI